MTRWSLFLQTLSLLHHFLGLYWGYWCRSMGATTTGWRIAAPGWSYLSLSMMPPATYRTRCSVMRKTLKATSSSYRALSSTEVFPWPSTVTATQSSSIHASLARRQPDRPKFARAMQELGIQQIFARSPEAKGRVERAAGTFQYRLVTELRLAGATTIEEANEVLWSYLPSFNEQFGVPPSQPTISYRSPDGLHVSSILCFKHRRKVARDKTVKFDWHTLQLLPSTDRPSYAGALVEVQERLDGELVVRQGNSTIPIQEAPPRPGALRALNGTSGRDTNELGGLLRSLPRYNVKDRKTRTRPNGVSKENPKSRRQPTPRQKARWKAVQRAKRRGLSLRGISRNTVRKYVLAKSPPMVRTHAKTRANGSGPQSETTDPQDSDTTTTDIFAEQLD